MSARWPKLAAKVLELEHVQRLADNRVCKKRRIGDANGGNLPGFPVPEPVAQPLLPAVANHDLIWGGSSDDGWDDGHVGTPPDSGSDSDEVVVLEVVPFDATIDWAAWEARCRQWRMFNSIFEQGSLPINIRRIAGRLTLCGGLPI